MACCAFLASTAAAGFSSSGKGTSSGEFLKIGQGARALALGEAYTALADDALALNWNPAGLARVPHISVVLAHTAYLESVNYEYAAAALKLSILGAVGASVQHQSVGDVTQRDNTGLQTGSFSPKDGAYTLGYAHNLGVLCVGLSAKYIDSKLADSATGMAVDAGIQTGPLLGDRFRLGATAANIGGKLKYDKASNDLPVTYRVGASASLTEGWVISSDVILPRDNKPIVAVGTEFGLALAGHWRLTPRFGYNTRSAGDVEGFTGFSAGLGFGLRKLSVDYALVPLGDLGLTHRFSLSFRL